MKPMIRKPGAFVAALLSASFAAHAENAQQASRLDRVEVTSSRFQQVVQEVPDAIAVITGEELRAQGATDLRSALALLGGVSVAPGGDLGPAGATPSILGRVEADDFLLLVDGVPAGSIFAPSFATLDLHNIERIEVLRGAAPVFYGTTSFAGTIHVIHYPAGSAERAATVFAGSFGSAGADASVVLSDGAVRQSVSADMARQRTDSHGSGSDRVHVLYRLASQTPIGAWRLDADITSQRQKPGSPTPVDAAGKPTLPADFNQNPADRKLDTDRYHLAAALDTKSDFGDLSSIVAYTHSRTRAVRGFVQEDFTVNMPNAVGFRQAREIDEVFADSHVTRSLNPSLALTVGINESYGRARQDSDSFDYQLPLDGSSAPNGADQPATGTVSMRATRSLFGVYAQSRWKPTPSIAVLGGLRWNLARQSVSAFDGTNKSNQASDTRRVSGSLGGSWRIWSDPEGDLDDVVVHALASNTFQLAQLDFGPQAGFDPFIAPEKARSLTVGVKADALEGRLDADLSWFLVHFDNQPLNGQIGGLPAVVGSGQTKFTGAEIESSYAIRSDLRLNASLSIEDARYRDFQDATVGQLSGNRVPFNPRQRAALGLTASPRVGWQGSATAAFTGSRYLDQQNLLHVGSYATFDLMLGYRWDQVLVRLSATNLSNRRDPVLRSELGDKQYYRLDARRIFLTVSSRF